MKIVENRPAEDRDDKKNGPDQERKRKISVADDPDAHRNERNDQRLMPLLRGTRIGTSGGRLGTTAVRIGIRRRECLHVPHSATFSTGVQAGEKPFFEDCPNFSVGKNRPVTFNVENIAATTDSIFYMRYFTSCPLFLICVKHFSPMQ